MIRLFPTGWARLVMIAHLSIFPPTMAHRWAIFRFIAASPRVPASDSNRWRAQFLTRNSYGGRDRWKLAGRLAVHQVFVDRPYLIIASVISFFLLVGVIMGRALQ